MNILLNSGWMKSIIAKAISVGLIKKTGVKAGLTINDLKIADAENGVAIHLDAEATISRDELERLIKDLM